METASEQPWFSSEALRWYICFYRLEMAAAICTPLESRRLKEENRGIIRIDRLTRYNAQVSIGDIVEISKANDLFSDKVIIKPLTLAAIMRSTVIDQRYLCDALTNIPFKSSNIVIILYFKVGLAFIVINLIPSSNESANVVSRTFIVTGDTKFNITY